MKTISLSTLSLREKIAQMIMVRADYVVLARKHEDENLASLGIGGIFLGHQISEEDYKKLIDFYNSKSKIKLFISADMEGYWNPFRFYKSKTFGEVKDEHDAHDLGKEHAKILKKLGFNLDFSPVVETRNTVWPGRTFTGSLSEVKQKISGYINGLQDNGIMATAKHYPGGSMEKNPHWFKVHSTISQKDLELFKQAIKDNVSCIMIGHAIVNGALNSKGKQSTVSPEVISHLRKSFKGVIFSDAIGMLGLRHSYLFNSKKLYLDLVNAGNDIILDAMYLTSNYKKAKKGISIIEDLVNSGDISQKRIDESVSRILKLKGYKIIR